MTAAQTKQKTPAGKARKQGGQQGGTARASARVVEDGRVVRGGKQAGGKGSAKARRARKPVYTAKTADKYELYQLAVQSPEQDVEFLARVYKSIRKKPALHFREDFCGTGLLSSHWIRRGEKYTAEGFDIDPEPVAWGMAHHFDDLGEEAARYTVHMKDVRAPSHRRPDVRAAQNFSYCIFRERAEMLEYLRAAHDDLAPDGVFVMDLHGGPEATEEMEEVRDCGGFDYVWDQDQFWPGTGEYVCHIHFRFPDGTELKRAFSYRWRMWYLTELKDLLLEAGFQQVWSYFEGTDKNGVDGNGIFRKGVRGENCESWLAYLAAAR
jgi:SAM-dependent methyltransferase